MCVKYNVFMDHHSLHHVFTKKRLEFDEEEVDGIVEALI